MKLLLTNSLCAADPNGNLVLDLSLPCSVLLQKVQFILEDDLEQIEFEQTFAFAEIKRRLLSSETEKTESVIDFKKEKIDWRFKTRMRSNSNEFLDNPKYSSEGSGGAAGAKYGRRDSGRGSKFRDFDSDNYSCVSSDVGMNSSEIQRSVLLSSIGSNF